MESVQIKTELQYESKYAQLNVKEYVKRVFSNKEVDETGVEIDKCDQTEFGIDVKRLHFKYVKIESQQDDSQFMENELSCMEDQIQFKIKSETHDTIDNFEETLSQQKFDNDQLDVKPLFICGNHLEIELPANPAVNEKLHLHVNKKFVCSYCSKSFPKEVTLLKHIDIHAVAKPFQCQECGKCYARRGTLQNHLRIHTDHRPFKCSLCDKSFSIRYSFNMHMKMHNGETPYKCVECGKGFPQKCDLTMHLIMHSGFQPFRCTMCQKSFNHKSNLRQHTRIHTGHKPFKCDNCTRCFTQRSQLKRHMRTHVRSNE